MTTRRLNFKSPLVLSCLIILTGCGGNDTHSQATLSLEGDTSETQTDTTQQTAASTSTSDTTTSSTQNTLSQIALYKGTTEGVQCDYSYNEFNNSGSVQATSNALWQCSGNNRTLIANGLPDHPTGQFPNANNPNEISEQAVSVSYSLTPVETSKISTLGGPRGATGYVLNGVKIDANTAGTCDDTGSNCSLIGNEGSWHIEALGQSSFNFGTDDNNAHVLIIIMECLRGLSLFIQMKINK